MLLRVISSCDMILSISRYNNLILASKTSYFGDIHVNLKYLCHIDPFIVLIYRYIDSNSLLFYRWFLCFEKHISCSISWIDNRLHLLLIYCDFDFVSFFFYINGCIFCKTAVILRRKSV